MEFSIFENNETKITIDVQSKCRPERTDDYDWIDYHVDMVMPGYRVSFDAQMTSTNIVRFLKELKRMHETLSGTAELDAIEGNIYLKGEMSKRGSVLWSGATTYPTGIGNKLSFEFNSDQTFLSKLIAELEDILK